MDLSALSIRRPVTTLMFYAGVVLLGIVSFNRLGVDFLPHVSIPRLTIHTACEDLAPREMDERVGQPICTAVGTVQGVKQTSSVSRRGIAIVTVEFSWGVDMDYAMLNVREKLDQIVPELPPEAERPVILRIDPSAEPVIAIGVSAAASTAPGAANLMELTETCNALLKKRLEQVEGVALVQVLGGAEREVRVEVNETKLQSLGLTVQDVADAIKKENVNLPGGSISRGPLRFPLRLLGELASARDIEQLSFVSRESGRSIRISEIATVRDTVRERNGWTTCNGNNILVLQVRKEAGSNTLVVSANVRQALEQLSRDNPGLRFDILNDQAQFIRDSVADVEQSILWGAALALLVLLLFLKGVAEPVIVGFALPVSILATLIAMGALGLSLNVISLTGLALGIGMLGDNAIIVIENVRRLREEGRSPTEAIVVGAREINLAVTASTLTNVAVFLPVLFVHTVAQQLFVDMAVTMTVSLLVSLLVAVTLVPVMLDWQRRFPDIGRRWKFHTDGMIPARIRKFPGLVDAWGKLWVDRLLRRALQLRGRVLGATALLFVASVLAAGFISSEPAPEIDRKKFVVEITAPAGTPLPLVEEFAGRVENMLQQTPGVIGAYVAGGIAASPDVWSIADASPGRIHIEATVADSMPTALPMEKVRTGLRLLCESLSGVGFTVNPGATTFERILRPRPVDIMIRIQGKDPSIDRRIAVEFAARIRHLSGLVDLSDPLRGGAPEYVVTLRREAAERYGVSAREVFDQIGQRTRASEATMLAGVDQQAPVHVQPEDLGTISMEDLLGSSMLCNGVPVPLRELVVCEQSIGEMEIRREAGSQTVVLQANAAGRSIGTVADAVRQTAASCLLPGGYSITVGGENEEMESSFRSLAIVIGLSLLLVYMILAAEYESLLYPLVILLTSPLAFVGAVLAMLVTGERYNVMSLVGIVIMIGAVDNDAVIAVDVITALRRSGIGLQESICRGMCQRLRPILMTTATTLLGILPLILNLGAGSELVRALTIPLAGGLITSTLFTLLVVPLVYSYIDPLVAPTS